jgi:hypothetical protein
MLVPPLFGRNSFKCCACPANFVVEPHLGFSSNNLDLLNKPINSFENTPLMDFNNFLYYYGKNYTGKQVMFGYLFKRDNKREDGSIILSGSSTASSFFKNLAEKKWRPVLVTFDGSLLRCYETELRMVSKEKKYKVCACCTSYLCTVMAHSLHSSWRK